MAIATQGVHVWNNWRERHLRVQPDLTRIDLSGADLRGVDFRGVGLFKANLSGADLRGAILRQSILINTDFRSADLTGAHVYGASVWDVDLTDASQNDLVITPPDQPVIAVDNLEIAQFIYLMLSNQKIRDVIDTLTSKAVLILGRFTPARKRVLEEIRMFTRQAGLLPILFDFEGPSNRDATETVSLLAHMARFVIADLTDQASVPHELMAVAPHVSVPIVPVVEAGSRPYSMFQDLTKYPWVKSVREYSTSDDIRTIVIGEIGSSA